MQQKTHRNKHIFSWCKIAKKRGFRNEPSFFSINFINYADKVNLLKAETVNSLSASCKYCFTDFLFSLMKA